MPFQFTTKLIKYFLFVLTFCLCTSFAVAQPGTQLVGDEDTILIEKQPSQKIPYHRILKSFTKKIFEVDVSSMFSIGKTRRDAFARNFKDYADRIKYRVNVRNKDEVELKLSMNF